MFLGNAYNKGDNFNTVQANGEPFFDNNPAKIQQWTLAPTKQAKRAAQVFQKPWRRVHRRFWTELKFVVWKALFVWGSRSKGSTITLDLGETQ